MSRKGIAGMALLGALVVSGSIALAQPKPAMTPKVEPAAKPAENKIDISVTEAGFEPATINVKAGQPVTLAFTRKTDKTCATEVVLYVNDKEKVERKLPLNETVAVNAKFDKTGRLGFACGMNMIKGVINVQ